MKRRYPRRPKLNVDAEIDNIYDGVDALLRGSCFPFLDRLLWDLLWRCEQQGVDIMLAWLTSTYPAKSKLPNRRLLLLQCKKLWPVRKLWKGLD